MSRELGNIGENEAQVYLKSIGFNIIENNYFARVGEVDIIATKEGRWHFIEVKSRSNMGFGQAVDNITRNKINKIIKASKRYLCEKEISEVDWQIDAVLIDPKLGTIEYMPNIYCEGLD